MHLGGHCYIRVKLLTSKGAEKRTVASVADCEVEADSPTAGHERKHNACRATDSLCAKPMQAVTSWNHFEVELYAAAGDDTGIACSMTADHCC